MDSYWSPMDSYWSPMDSYWSPMDSYWSPMDSYWSPTGVLESSRNRWRSEKYWAPLPHVTTIHITIIPNSHGCSQPPSTAYKHSTQPPTAMWQCHVTSHNNHQDQQPQMMKKAPKRMQMTCSQTMASTYEQTQATASRGETACPPPLISLTANPGATLPSATWQPDDERRHRSLLLGHHGEPPLSPIPPNPPYSDTG